MIKRTSTNNNFESKHKDNPEILYGYYNGLKDITNAIITLATEDGISEKDAIKLVAKERNVAKSIIYKEYHNGK